MVKYFDYKIVGLSNFYSISKLAPLTQELELANSFTGNVETLDVPSRYVYETRSIRNMGRRLDLFKFAMEFYDSAQKSMKAIKMIIDTCKFLKTNENFLEFLRQMLLAGNILDEGTRRGNAMGFRVIQWRCL
jgi:hypothetical protein